MTVSISISDETQSRLEELQAQIRLETEREVTQQELLTRLIAALESRDNAIDSRRERTVPASQEEIDAFHKGTFNSGTETDEEDLDDICY
jgi:hypothetical protein